MMTRQEMIDALTRHELQKLLDNPYMLSDMVDFFAAGGFDLVNPDDLEEVYKKEMQ